MNEDKNNRTGRLYTAAKAMILVCALAILAVALFTKFGGSLCLKHQWHDGVCSGCGKICDHRYIDGTCTVCGAEETVVVEDTISAEKTGECEHLYWTAGVCDSCGYVCPHEEHDRNGICNVCGGDCLHFFHSTAGVCKLCGAEAGHTFIQGRCSVCGLSYTPVRDFIGMDYFAEPEHPGTLETVSYVTRDYTGSGETIERLLDVYLPYGYSDENRYDVLLLLNGEENTWLASPQKYYDRETDLVYDVDTINLIANMTEAGECNGLIVASPHYPMQSAAWYSGIPDDQKVQFSTELRHDLLPYVAENYSTCADGTEISAARNHFGAVGCGYGADLLLTSTMPDNIDLVSWYGTIAPRTSDMKAVGDGLLADSASKEMTVNYFYVSAGEWDDAAPSSHRIYSDALSYVNQIDSDNSTYVQVSGAYHDGRSWTIGLYNCLRLFFGLK